jgi:hypothetical protein
MRIGLQSTPGQTLALRFTPACAKAFLQRHDSELESKNWQDSLFSPTSMPNTFAVVVAFLAVSSALSVDVQPRLAAPPPGAALPEAPAANWTTATTAGACNWTAYKQCDPAWKNEKLGTSPTNTICSAGCAMSSLSMYLTTRGHKYTPGTLNKWLNGHGGYADGDLLVWGAVNSLGVSYQGKETDVSVATLTAGLAACHGIIANVRSKTHWVLLTGHASGSTFNVHDPGFAQATYDTSEMSSFAVYH